MPGYFNFFSDKARAFTAVSSWRVHYLHCEERLTMKPQMDSLEQVENSFMKKQFFCGSNSFDVVKNSF